MAELTTTHCDWCHRDVTTRKPYEFAATVEVRHNNMGPNSHKREDTEDQICKECREALGISISRMKESRGPRVTDRV